MKHTLSISIAATAAALLSACTHPGVSGTGAGGDAIQRSVRDAIAREQSLRADTISVRTLGVTPMRLLTSDTVVAPLAFGLADIMMTDLARSSQLVIVDRVRLETLLDELKLVSAGRVDSATAPRVGRIVGARRLVLGSIGSISGGNRTILIDARIADVADGTVRPAVTATAPLADILAAEKELVLRIFDQLGVNLTPAERATISERQTRDLGALLAYGRAVRFETEGRYADAEEQYAEALRIDPAFRLADLRLREVRRLRRDRASSRRASGDNSRPSDALLAVLQSVSRSDIFPLGGRGAGDPSFPLLNGTLIIIITAR